MPRPDGGAPDGEGLFAGGDGVGCPFFRHRRGAGTVARAWLEYDNDDVGTKSRVYIGVSGQWHEAAQSRIVREHRNKIQGHPIRGLERGGDAECKVIDQIASEENRAHLRGAILFVEIAGAEEICRHCRFLLTEFVKDYGLLAWRSEGTRQGRYQQL